MRKFAVLTLLTALSFIIVATGRSVDFGSEDDSASIEADIVATGIPGAGAIAQVGTFHKGGPFHDRSDFAAFTQPGQVLDRTRLFVASTSNFGAPVARPAEAPGSIVSIDASEGLVVVPPTFAAGGGQASAVGGKVIL